MRPLRIVGHQLKRLDRIVKLTPAVINQCGGVWRTIFKIAGVIKRQGIHGVRRSIIEFESGMNDYGRWIKLYDTMDDKGRERMRQRITAMEQHPLISIIMPVYNPHLQWLEEAIDSVRSQIYPHWELCVADDCSTAPHVRETLERYQAIDSRIKVVFRDRNGHISEASNSALAIAEGDWVALMDQDDLLPEHALFWVADAINKNPDAGLVYSGEDKVDANGNRFAPYFKPAWNIDLFYSQNLISHLGCYRLDILRDINGFRTEYNGSQDYDLALRVIERLSDEQIVHIPRILYHWRVHEKSTASSADAKPYAMIAGERAITDHFHRVGIAAKCELIDHGYRVHYDLPAPTPLVSIIVVYRNEEAALKKCLDSVLKKTDYSRYEIIVIDNRPDEATATALQENFYGESRVSVISDGRPFNFSALNNAAVDAAKGEFICLLNLHTEVITSGWMKEMVSLAAQPGVGAVGARLWYPDDTLQHGGIVLGIDGVAGYIHRNLRKGQPGYFGRASLIQSISAVSTACLVVRKSIYREAGGLDEERVAAAFHDVDFCLKLLKAGYRNIWTPYAELYYHEVKADSGIQDISGKHNRFGREVSMLQDRWGEKLLNDPCYNPNLTLETGNFGLAWPPRIDFV